MAYQIHIVDDSPADAERLEELTQRWAGKRELSVELMRHPSAEAFLFRYEENKACDLLLLDIEMTGMDGVTLAKTVRRENEAVSIVFVTGYSDYIGEGYDVAALHYLMKPVNEDKLEQVLDRALARRLREERALTLKTAEEVLRVPLSHVLWLEAARNYVNLREADGRVHTVRGTLSEMEKQLDDRFMRVGRSFIVNLTKLHRITRTDMTFPDGSSLPVPRGYYEVLNRAIIKKL